MPPKELSLQLMAGDFTINSPFQLAVPRKMRTCWPLAPVDTGPPRFRGASEGEPEGEPLSERREIGGQLVRWRETIEDQKHTRRVALIALLLFLVGKLLLDSLPCSRPEVPAIVIPAAMEFLRPLQRIDRGLRRQTIVLIITAIGNVDRGHRPLQLIESVPKTSIPRSGFAFYITAIIAAGQPQGRWAAVVTSAADPCSIRGQLPGAARTAQS
jgi:hypothetical protein